MLMGREHKAALVTGAANGIGRTMTLALLANGIDVVAVDRDGSALSGLAATVGPGRLSRIVADLHESTLEPVVQRIREAAPSIDILINNAGIGPAAVRRDYHTRPARFWDVPIDMWDRFFAVNTRAAFILMQALAPPMIDRGFGRIVNVTTSLGSMIRGGYVPYGPSKAGLEALTAIAASDLAGSGVTANVLIPGGAVDTALVPDEAPFLRSELLSPEIMVRPLLWLLSSAAAEVTGQRLLAVDWDPNLPDSEAAARCSSAAAWRSLATLPVLPKGSVAFADNPA